MLVAASAILWETQNSHGCPWDRRVWHSSMEFLAALVAGEGVAKPSHGPQSQLTLEQWSWFVDMVHVARAFMTSARADHSPACCCRHAAALGFPACAHALPHRQMFLPSSRLADFTPYFYRTLRTASAAVAKGRRRVGAHARVQAMHLRCWRQAVRHKWLEAPSRQAMLCHAVSLKSAWPPVLLAAQPCLLRHVWPPPSLPQLFVWGQVASSPESASIADQWKRFEESLESCSCLCAQAV